VNVGWDDDPVVAGWPGLAPLPGDRTADACVVGLGGSGLAAVAALVERGLSVVGIDAGRVAAGAAGRNGGFLLGGPAAYLHTAFALWGEAAAVQLYRDTLVELRHLEDLLGADVVRRESIMRRITGWAPFLVPAVTYLVVRGALGEVEGYRRVYMRHVDEAHVEDIVRVLRAAKIRGRRLPVGRDDQLRRLLADDDNVLAIFSASKIEKYDDHGTRHTAREWADLFKTRAQVIIDSRCEP